MNGSVDCVARTGTWGCSGALAAAEACGVHGAILLPRKGLQAFGEPGSNVKSWGALLNRGCPTWARVGLGRQACGGAVMLARY